MESLRLSSTLHGMKRRPPGAARREASPSRGAATTNKRANGPSRRARKARSVALLLAVVTAALVVVQATRNPPSADSAQRVAPKISVGVVSCTFVDPTRPTVNYATGTNSPGRRLVTEIRYPTIRPTFGLAESPNAAPYRRQAPYPLVVFAHGYDITPQAYAKLLDVWVKAGFVVAAPIFPDTNSATILAESDANTESDIDNQPADVAFVIKQLLSANATGTGCSALNSLIQPAKIALAGQSDGGDTVAALAFENLYRDPALHFSAVEVLSGALMPPPSPAQKVTETGAAPLLVVQSATDLCNPPGAAIQLYSSIVERDKWFVTLKRAPHLPPYTDVVRNANFSFVAAETTKFFEDEFSGIGPNIDLHAIAASFRKLGYVTSGPPPPLRPLTFVNSACFVK